MDIETLRRTLNKNESNSEKQTKMFKDVLIDMSLDQIRALRKLASATKS